jgi:hypothetical protein
VIWWRESWMGYSALARVVRAGVETSWLAMSSSGWRQLIRYTVFTLVCFQG